MFPPFTLRPRYDSDVLDRIARFADRHAMFPPGQRIGVAVSGGADSVFLLHALRELAPRSNLHLSVIHIDHGIRGPASQADAEFVAQLAADLALPFHLRHADIPSLPGNLEQNARNARLSFYRDLITSGTADRIATGHTRSDQAETVLYRILRGSGLTGLAGILPVTSDGLVRPLLEIDRGEIECWLRNHAIPWREDSTNDDVTLARNRLRHEILPLLRDRFNPQLDQALANLATLARDDESYWQSELALRSPLPPQSRTPESQILATREITSSTPSLARRLIRRAIEAASGSLRSVDFAQIERILAMAHSPNGHDRIQIAGLDVWRSFDKIRFATPDQARATQGCGFSIALQIPGSVELPGSHARIHLQVLANEERRLSCDTLVDELDWDRLHAGGHPPILELRNWRPGDQYRRVGHSKPQKIKFFLQKARIPLWERVNWPILTYNGVVIWSGQFGAAAEFAATPQTRRVLRISDSREESVNEVSNPS